MTQKIDEDERRAVRDEFHRLVNMSQAALAKWLAGEESQSVGMRPDGERVTQPGGGESVGHHMGERIEEIRGRKQADLTEDDYRDMRKVVGYIHRHSKQRPSGDVTNTRWRYSLMNWGHDPLED